VTEPTHDGSGPLPRVDANAVVETVTFFEDRAEVVRRARVVVRSGVTLVVLAGPAVVVDDTSVVVRVKQGEARVLDTRVVRTVRREPAASGEQLAKLEQEARAARKARAAADASLARIACHERRLLTLMEGVIQAVARVPRGEGRIGTWKDAYEELDRVTMETLDEASEARQAVDRARLAESRADAALALARRADPRYEAMVETQVEAVGDQSIDLELTYRLPCALWRPEHVIRAVRRPDAGGFDLHIRTYATVWQVTGERWEDVRGRFSTARPSRASSPPLLTEDLIQTRKKTDAERRQVVVEAREQMIETAGASRGIQAVEDMPGVDDGGEPQWFEARTPVTIPSDGMPVRVEIGSVTLPCRVDWVAYPEKADAVHVRATATLASSYPLLAGPVWVGRENELVGRSKTKFIGRGESFEVGLGPDDGMRVRRVASEQRDTTAVIGTQKVTREVQVYVTNLGAARRRLHVIERFPVSEIESVRVKLLSAEGARIDARDGMAAFEMDLAGNATTTVKLAYRIEATANVVLP